MVCDTDRLIIHTNFTGTASKTHQLDLTTLEQPESLELLRAMFFEPEKLRPTVTVVRVTEEAATQLGDEDVLARLLELNLSRPALNA